ncbi:hypothetical protein CHS0354_042383 [Potamilus streckersoni]|uniref:Uncharacterized protein n=1 Tax=Potamilus streckersoni TaxID=2493646 RepID=A0AAE0W2G2_9BIVA|nr:hypothetical protein CHS0354_042383 [Potamilus streckersoni]
MSSESGPLSNLNDFLSSQQDIQTTCSSIIRELLHHLKILHVSENEILREVRSVCSRITAKVKDLEQAAIGFVREKASVIEDTIEIKIKELEQESRQLQDFVIINSRQVKADNGCKEKENDGMRTALLKAQHFIETIGKSLMSSKLVFTPSEEILNFLTNNFKLGEVSLDTKCESSLLQSVQSEQSNSRQEIATDSSNKIKRVGEMSVENKSNEVIDKFMTDADEIVKTSSLQNDHLHLHDKNFSAKAASLSEDKNNTTENQCMASLDLSQERKDRRVLPTIPRTTRYTYDNQYDIKGMQTKTNMNKDQKIELPVNVDGNKSINENLVPQMQLDDVSLSQRNTIDKCHDPSVLIKIHHMEHCKEAKGLVILQDGRLVVGDLIGQCIILYSRNYSYLASHKFDQSPDAICKSRSNSVLVALSKNCLVSEVEITKDGFRHVQTFNTESSIASLCFLKECIFVGTEDGEVAVYRYDGLKKEYSVELDMMGPVSSIAMEDEHVAYIINGRETVALDMKKREIIWRYSNEYYDPWSLDIHRGILYVTDNRERRIVTFSKQGAVLGDINVQLEGTLWSICVNRDKRSLLVEVGGNTLAEIFQ